MSCEGCKCNFCAHSCELPARFITIGEVDEVCFTCDDCKHWGGDYSKRSMWRQDCPNYLEPQKFADHCAHMQRAKLRIVKHAEGVTYHMPGKPPKAP